MTKSLVRSVQCVEGILFDEMLRIQAPPKRRKMLALCFSFGLLCEVIDVIVIPA